MAENETQQPTVELRGVSKSYGGTLAVRDVSLTVRRGEIVTLLGPSGCGKTTLLNMIAGFADPDSGDVVISGRSVADVPPHHRSLGMVFQNYALFPHMSVTANIAFGLRMRGMAKVEMAGKVAAALDLVRLTGMEDRKPHELSGGQRQRVALARALVIDPDVLLLDEPLSALDKNLRAQMQVELKEIQRRIKVTTICVTHDQSEALSISDRIAVMANGQIQQVARPAELYLRPETNFVASFVGDNNRIECTIVEITQGAMHVQFPATGGAALLPVPLEMPEIGDTVDLYVRPETISLHAHGLTAANASAGVVRTVVFQGSHTDLIIETERFGTLLVRTPDIGYSNRDSAALLSISIDWQSARYFPRQSAAI